MERLILEKADGVAKIVLNRPEVLNALDLKTFDELAEAVAEVAADRQVRAVIIAGAGRAFCTGIDLSFIHTIASLPAPEFQKKLREMQGILSSLEELNKPVVAAVNGYALGAGCDLALACDLRIASEKAVFGEQYIKVGLMPDLGGTQRLPRVVGVAKAKELIFTGDHVNAQEAYRIGMVNKVVAVDELLPAAETLAKRLAAGPSVAIGMAKRAINKGLDVDLQSGLEYEVYGQSICLQTADVKEGVAAFLEKREPKFKGE